MECILEESNNTTVRLCGISDIFIKFDWIYGRFRTMRTIPTQISTHLLCFDGVIKPESKEWKKWKGKNRNFRNGKKHT